jgi:hypothetical protein
VSGIFVSHSSADDRFVAELRTRLEEHGHELWVDSRRLSGGDLLGPQIQAAIEDASHVLVVLSPKTVNSTWVSREVRAALRVQQERGPAYRIVPILREGITEQALGVWFPDEEPVAVMIGPDGLVGAMPELLAALGDRLPTDREEPSTREAGVVDELILRLSGLRIRARDGSQRVWATAQLVHEPADPDQRAVESRPFGFAAPLGPIEMAELRWYLESYWRWPVGVFRSRAAVIEARLPDWGRALLGSIRGDGRAFDAWERAGSEGALRRFSILVDDSPPVDPADQDDEALTAAATETAREAAVELLRLPWELLHDGDTWLFQGRNAVRVRRRLPHRTAVNSARTLLPIRILLVSPRPERTSDGRPIGFIDHRASALPLVEAVEDLGDLARDSRSPWTRIPATADPSRTATRCRWRLVVAVASAWPGWCSSWSRACRRPSPGW